MIIDKYFKKFCISRSKSHLNYKNLSVDEPKRDLPIEDSRNMN